MYFVKTEWKNGRKLFDAHHVFGFVVSYNLHFALSESSIQGGVASVNPQTLEASQFAFGRNHEYVV
jgi:hypothetical protein